jgi:glycosyltransferase involved in cell wall biosynthesis
MPPTVSFIIPTLGRPSLRETLESLRPQLAEGDEVLVVGDGPQPAAAALVGELGGLRFHYFSGDLTNCWGHEQRNLGMKLAVGDYLAFLDDDDVSDTGALEAIREAAQRHRDRPLLFRMHHQDRVIWEEKAIKTRNVSTQMFVVPNVPSKLAVWKRNPEGPTGSGGDFHFIKETVELWGPEELVFADPIIATLDRHRKGSLE